MGRTGWLASTCISESPREATGWEGPPGADLPRNTRLRWVEGTASLLTLRLYQLAAGIFTSSPIPLPSRQDTLMWVSELPSPSTM